MSASSISLLDNVITAVEVGFSYDGIVSVPETGLEDAGQRPGLAGRIQRGMKAIQKVLRKLGITPKRAPSMNDQAESPAHPDSDADDEKGLPTGGPPPPPGSPQLPRKKSKQPPVVTAHGETVKPQVQPGPSTQTSPTRDGEQEALPPPAGMKSPRKKSNRLLGDTARRETEGPQVQSGPGVQEPPSDSSKLPRKKSKQLPGDTTREEDEGFQIQLGPSVQGGSVARKGEQGPLPPSDSPKSPRKKSNQLLGDTARREDDGPRIQSSSSIRGGPLTSRGEHGDRSRGLKSPRKRSGQLPRDVSYANMGQTSSMPMSGVAIHQHPPDISQMSAGRIQPQIDDPGKSPRKRKEEVDPLPDIDPGLREPGMKG